jgi:rRNA maturation endonuclease Nob1
MPKKCIYCKTEIPMESVIDFCSRCGKGVWGEKMFNTILKNMQDASDKGDLVSTNTVGISEVK